MSMVSCQKESPLVVSDSGTNVFYQLPQGNHPYDDEIVEFYKNYNCFILYKFSNPDYNYNWTGPVDVNLSVNPADTMYISDALKYLHKNLFDIYPSQFLKATMPFSILLASKIKIGNVQQDLNMISDYSAISSLRSLSFGLVNDSLQTLTGPDLDLSRGWLHMAYWNLLIKNNMLSIPEGFQDLSISGKTTSDVVIRANPHKYGVLPPSLITAYLPQDDYITDFLGYIQVITSTDSTSFANTWLVPSVDINGLYREKYDLIVNYYKDNYGVDLQAIGDFKN